MNKKALIILLVAGISYLSAVSQQLAFPGAEGFGKYALGGRTGSVYHVTNLNDAGTGSFRDAVTTANRIVVFDVAGVIKISSTIAFAPNLYIAGQTAPGEGITVYGERVSFSGANNTICRYMKFRMGVVGTSGKDAVGIANGSNMIFDHVSVSWGRDETFSISWDGKGTEPTNITIQNSIVSQGLLSHSAGGLIQTDGGVTLYRNCYIDNDTRNNKIKGVNQYVNNIVYNWKSAAYIMGGESEGQSYANCVSNYFVKGPAGGNTPLSGANANFHIYAADNWFDNNTNGTLDGYLVPFSQYSGGPDFQSVPYDYPILPTLQATALMDSLLPFVGASLPCRDLVDYYVINEFKSFGKKGVIITNENELPFGTPNIWTLWAGTSRTDSDTDGMPDTWETANSLNPASASDAMAVASNGYTNIENYINSISEANTQDFLRAPLCLKLDSAKQTSLFLSWFDYTEKETGYIVERYVNNAFVEIGRTGVNENTFEVTGLIADETDTFRVRAFNGTVESGNSNSLIAKTLPVPVEVLDPETFVPDLTWSGTQNSNWEKVSLNWENGTMVFSDSSRVLFPLQSTEVIIDIVDTVGIKSMFVKSESNYIFQGTGYLSGQGSVNKTGSGKLSLRTSNSYTGATVLWGGTLELNLLANGGLSSSIGASPNYNFNWVLKGGKVLYSGSSVSTDRNIALDGTTEFEVNNGTTVLTMSGAFAGSGGLIKSGAGKILFKTPQIFTGEAVIKGGIIELNGVATINAGVGASNILRLEGGGLKTSGGSNTVDENYFMDIIVKDSTVNSFEPYRNCQIKSKVSGSGTLNFNITYVREYITGDWSQFSGILKANGLGTSSDGNQLMLNNGIGLPNTRVVTSGNTKIICWKNGSTMYLGGLSGPAGSYLSGADKQNNAATMTWVIGGAGSDETFNGVINNECSNRNYKGVTTIVKEGDGIWRLTGANIYAGTTTVTGGTLIVNGMQTGTSKVTVQTDSKLAGTGKMPGIVEIQTGATIEPGDGSIGTFTTGPLTLQTGSIVNMDINKTLGTSDRIASSGAVSINGKLNLTVTGTLVAGDQFTIFTGTSFTGTFEEIVPATPGVGLEWKFTNGLLRVVDPLTDPVKEVAADFVYVAPNPVKDICKVHLASTYKNVEVTVESVNGSCVLSTSGSNCSELNLKVNTLKKGVYFVKIFANGEQLPIQRIVKQ